MQIEQFLHELYIARYSLLDGLVISIQIFTQAIIFGTILGGLIGIIMTYSGFITRFFVRIYIDFIRGTPVFVLVLASYYIPSVLGVNLTPYEAGIFSLTMFCSSHVSEIVRGALQALPRGQTEAAQSIGLTFWQSFVYVLFPQAIRQILPTWVNASTEIVKASTLLSAIGTIELFLSIQQVISRTYLSLEFYFFAGFIYFLINFCIEKFGKYLEHKTSIEEL